MSKPIKKEDIITQEDADIIMATAMVKAYEKEIHNLRGKIRRDYGKEIEIDE